MRTQGFTTRRPQSPATPVAGSPRRAGFSLIEVLLALGIFAIGFVAIASIFPAGALIQRNAANDTLSRNLARNAEAFVKSATLTQETIGGETGDLDTVKTFSLVQRLPTAAPDVLSKWNEDSRSYPSYIANTTERDFYWVPLVHQTDTATPTPATWRVYLFILERTDGVDYTTNGSTYPPLTHRGNTPGLAFEQCAYFDVDTLTTTTDLTSQLSQGDSVLTSDGNIYKVKEVTTTSISLFGYIDSNWGTTETAADWGLYYAPPGDTDTGAGVVYDDNHPTHRIVGPLSNLVTEAQ